MAPVLTLRTDYLVKRHTDLDELLFDEEHEYLDLNAVKKFDRFDFIFIDGKDTLPWSMVNHKLVILLRMAMKTNKCVFGSGYVADLFAYICSTAGKITTVLHHKKNQVIGDIDTKSLPNGAVYIDEITGDSYRWSNEERIWRTVLNVGVYARYSIHPDTALVQKKYPRQLLSQTTFYKNRSNETICKIKKIYLHHFLFKFLGDNEIKVANTGKLNISESSNRNCSQKFTVLAHSRETTPLILEYGNIIMLQFDVSLKYTNTPSLLKAYVAHKFNQMQTLEHVDVTCGALLVTTKNPLSPSRGVDPAILASMGKETCSMVRPVTRPSSAASASSKTSHRKTTTFTQLATTSGHHLQRQDSEITLPPREALPCTPRIYSTTGTDPIFSIKHKVQSKGLTRSNPEEAPNVEKFTNRSNDSRIVVNTGRKFPFCNYRKFQEMSQIRTEGVTVRASGPYTSQFDRDIITHMTGKAKWMAPDGFITATRGLRSLQCEHPVVGVIAGCP